jgi:hypothetical protein
MFDSHWFRSFPIGLKPAYQEEVFLSTTILANLPSFWHCQSLLYGMILQTFKGTNQMFRFASCLSYADLSITMKVLRGHLIIHASGDSVDIFLTKRKGIWISLSPFTEKVLGFEVILKAY